MSETNTNPESQTKGNIITKGFLKMVIRQGENRQDVSVKSFTVSPGCDKGMNFASEVLSVHAKLEIGGKEEEETRDLVIKVELQGGLIKDWIEERADFYAKEAQAYMQVIPAMVFVQSEKGLHPVQPPCPMHYYSKTEGNNRLTVLKDLRPEGYALSNKRIGLNEAECALLMREIATFHALGYMLGKTRKEEFSMALKEAMFSPPTPDIFKHSCKTSFMLVRQISNDMRILSAIDKLERLDLYDVSIRQLGPIEPYSVICHGDLWRNNIMFKYRVSGETKIPIDVKLLDLQMIRYALPTTDLAYFFFTSTTRTMRKKNLSRLLAQYYQYFTEHLERLDLEIPGFTLECFMKMYKQTALFGVIVAMFLLTTILSSEDNATDFTQSSENVTEQLTRLGEQLLSKKENRYILRERLVGGIEECIEMGVL